MSENAGNATPTYSCAVGHRVGEHELEALTEVLTLDQGALVRVCKQHGASITITRVPSSGDPT